ncbi:tyrosine-protein kinase Etk/Wzc [Parabacteroides sp. PH5-13]|uniref:GumC family protein n=1 Tax=unclassified Parabacteroides TaxID=2649774 RepID=UPI00247577CB|nr:MULTISPECIES: tyrosine-protein kinase family protein [unclassified Parabacteroides]MDH6305596.1 tyrosine-protein kinase Etk/Wzc [Parabacteroides sp. PH5-39]MDH6319849.1 tyrosine-protein kinase Etk/Wzc [Parabacteroides sp. PH5-13]MDH6323560.1 tyrosine-protein kinase Etk/Wzc [Parabacteroides sp. PH5-8]MDH6384672.1 tyrosine-protein kinase Etk/Wzc [Parabacteroides sp. PH5-17]MDH6394027.1 tyrosine-protein kinase Etk/Wzc [Parabacteroides sp. PFB2-22]
MDSTQNNFNLVEEEENEFSLSDIIQVVRIHWLWFAGSVVVCLFLAFLYLQWAPKIYTRTATVLIKDDAKGGGGASESAAFAELDVFNITRNVENEILVFRSRELMKNVVNRLHLDISYTQKKGLRTKELYSRSPITVQFIGMEERQAFSFRVDLSPDKKEVRIYDYSDDMDEGGKDIDLDTTIALNDTIETAFGKILITPTFYYTEDFYNATITVAKRDIKRVILDYSEQLGVSLANKQATIINLSIKDESIPRAEDVLNTLIAIYNEDAINDKNQIMVNTSEFINERLIIIEKELGNVDTDIEVYKRSQRLTDIRSETGMYLTESSQYSKEDLDLQNQKTLVGYIRDYLSDPARSASLIPANTGVTDANLETQISEYNNTLLKRDRLISNSSDRNPVVMNLNNSLSAMRQSILRAVDNLIVGLDIKIRNVRAREQQTVQRISAVPTQQKEVLTIERQQKIKEELYLYLLNKREENALSQSMTEKTARVIDPANGEDRPVAPKTSVILLTALIIGVVIPGGGLWLQQALNTKVRNRRDIESVLSIPFLGDIPERDKKDQNEIVVKESGRDSVSESFRIIRTNMDFMRVKAETLQVVMFTSFNPGSGKTFVSSNLAMSIVQTGKNVLLLDLDIRKGTLSSRMGGDKNATGVTNYLSGKVTQLEKIINHTELKGLDIVYAGPVPPNPAELLLSERLDEMLAELRKHYHYIIVDNVPATVVADAAIVNRVADLTIYVVRAGNMDKRQLPELERLYQQKKFKNMSVVLNAVDYKYSGYGYGGYGYGYGHTYGYGND